MHAVVVYLYVKGFLGMEPAYYGCDITSALLPSITRGLLERLQFFFLRKGCGDFFFYRIEHEDTKEKS